MKKNHAKQNNKILVYLWIPLSIGVMFWGTTDLGGLQLHHLAVLPLYLYAAALSISQRTLLSLDKKIFILLLYVVVTGLVQNYQDLGFWLKTFSFCGVAIVANHISKTMDLKEFITLSFKALKFTFLASLLFTAAFTSISFHEVDGANSLNSFYGQKNTYGRLLYFFIFFCIYAYKIDKKKPTLLAAGYIAVALLALGLTNSRTSQATAIIIILAPLALHMKWTSKAFKVGIIISAVTAIALIALDCLKIENTGGNHDLVSLFSLEIPMSGRTTIWSGGINALNLEHKWLFGFGLEGFYNSPYAKYVTNIGLGDFVPSDSHNGYIDLLLNLGLVGALIYISILYRFLTNTRKTTSPEVRSLFYMFFLIYIISNFTESFFVKTSNITSFMFLLLYLYSYKHIKTTKPTLTTHYNHIENLALPNKS
ncbi:O-antigen ligase family protein [Pseudomonas sp. CCC4.1]|uniref:O-antigen ligase family protein n=1 Tax=Pseudomonas sp. CCC4.1 TaxID=3048610 RepID=UPI002AB49AE4|nr:O-antigen ligase family protein [Pseudomonas sp. CCC4.1]MDY7570127.1 O-antigen ligase family protein [Pseudomonas sp. CCC4.1]MEB0145505.1 O-antigen ligase family protein [Pseudomonas sp. CCC4.1]